MKSQRITYPNQNLVINAPEVDPFSVAPPPTPDDLADVVGNIGFFNSLSVGGNPVGAAALPITGPDALTYIQGKPLFTGPNDLIFSASGAIFFQTNIDGAWKWKIDKVTGAWIPFGTNNAADIGDGSYCVRNILFGGILWPRGSGRETGVVQNRIKAGIPTDADMPSFGASDGMLVVDTQNNKIWVRVTGVWKGVVVA